MNTFPKTYITVLTTLPDEESARKVARQMVMERLAACCNLFPINSVYRWEGQVVEDGEYMVVMKTRASLYPALEKRLKDIHPYSLPEIISQDIAKGETGFLAWIEGMTGRDKDGV